MKEKRALTARILQNAVVILLLSAGAAKAGNVLEIVVEHPMSHPLASVEDLRNMLLQEGDEIREGMAKTGDGRLFDLVKAHLEARAEQAKRVDYKPGQFFRWMLYRRNGQGMVHAEMNATWTGEAQPPIFQFSEAQDGIRYVVRAVRESDWQGDSLPAFEFSVVDNGRRYVFAVPLCCGNLALKEVVSDLPETTAVAATTEFVQVSADTAVQEPVVVQEFVAEPQVEVVYVDREVRVPVEVVRYVDRPVYVDRPAAKTAKHVRGEKQSSRHANASSLHFVSDAGYLRQSDPADYGLGRLGFEYLLGDRFSFLTLGGGAVKASGTDGEDAFVLDFLLQCNLLQSSASSTSWAPFFVGIGVGAWMTSSEDELKGEDSGGDVIANVGVRLLGRPNGFSAALFLEARAAMDEMDQLSEYGRFGGGLRLRF